MPLKITLNKVIVHPCEYCDNYTCGCPHGRMTTPYNGQGWFWHHEYRHYLRDATDKQRYIVYKRIKLLKKRINVDDVDDKIEAICKQVCKDLDEENEDYIEAKSYYTKDGRKLDMIRKHGVNRYTLTEVDEEFYNRLLSYNWWEKYD